MADVRAIHEKLMEIAMLGDAAWFQENPDRRIRARKAVSMEFNRDLGRAPAGMAWYALVLEAQPGARMRQPVALPSDIVLNTMGDQDLYAIFMKAAPAEAGDMLRKLRSAKLPDAPLSAPPGKLR